MKKILLTSMTLLATTLLATPNAEKIFDAKCAMCHIKTIPQDRSQLVAPPLMGVMRHVKMQYPTKHDAVVFIVDYVQNPSRAKAVCMQQKIKRFGLMPSQKGNITPAELQKVASWMFDNYPPSNFRGGMMQKKSMKKYKRPTFEMFDANGDGVITKDEFQAFQNKRMRTKNGSCAGMMQK